MSFFFFFFFSTGTVPTGVSILGLCLFLVLLIVQVVQWISLTSLNP